MPRLSIRRSQVALLAAHARATVTAALEARGLVKRYGEREALRGVDFEARAGELVAVIGPNGAGKTTLLSILAGIVKPDEGEVRVPDGDGRLGARSRRRSTGG